MVYPTPPAPPDRSPGRIPCRVKKNVQKSSEVVVNHTKERGGGEVRGKKQKRKKVEQRAWKRQGWLRDLDWSEG